MNFNKSTPRKIYALNVNLKIVFVGERVREEVVFLFYWISRHELVFCRISSVFHISDMTIICRKLTGVRTFIIFDSNVPNITRFSLGFSGKLMAIQRIRVYDYYCNRLGNKSDGIRRPIVNMPVTASFKIYHPSRR